MTSPAVAKVVRLLRDRAAIIAGFAGVGVVGILIGRASMSSTRPAETAPVSSTSAAPAVSVAEPQVFEMDEDPRVTSGIQLRPMDRDILNEIMALKIDRQRMRDVFPDRPYRVAFIGSVHEHRIGAVMIDMNRDGHSDERWEIRQNQVSRYVEKDPNAGGTPVKYTLRMGRWQVH